MPYGHAALWADQRIKIAEGALDSASTDLLRAAPFSALDDPIRIEQLRRFVSREFVALKGLVVGAVYLKPELDLVPFCNR